MSIRTCNSFRPPESAAVRRMCPQPPTAADVLSAKPGDDCFLGADDLEGHHGIYKQRESRGRGAEVCGLESYFTLNNATDSVTWLSRSGDTSFENGEYCPILPHSWW